MKKKKALNSDVMLMGGDAKRVMRFMTRDRMVVKFEASMDEGGESMEEMIAEGNEERLRRMTAAKWRWDQETDVEGRMAELVDARRHGAYRAQRIHQEEVTHLDLNGKLDAVARRLVEIRDQQLSRGVANGNSYRKLERIEWDDQEQQAEAVDQNPPTPEAEPATTATAKIEIVHPPIVEGSLADYNAAQDAVEIEFAYRNPTWYLRMNGGEKGDVIFIADVEHLQRHDPHFDNRMHMAMPNVERVINNHPSNPARGRGSFQEVSPPSDHPHVRDSERPAGDV